MVIGWNGVGVQPPTLTSQGWFFHHDRMYARNWQSPLCVYSVAHAPPFFHLCYFVSQLRARKTPWDLHMFIVIFDILFYIHSFHHINTGHSSVAIRRGYSPSPHRWSAQWEKPPWGVEPRIELCNTASRRTLNWATLLCTELRRTLTDGFTGVLVREKLLTLVVTWKNHASMFLVIINKGMLYS
jgi:hypothetical protein